MTSLIECPNCKQTLEKPVILPCGHTICKKHEADRSIGERIKCGTCNSDHHIPKKSFPPNLLVEQFLNLDFDELNDGPEHRVAVESFDDLKRLVDELTRLRDEPGEEVSRRVAELKCRVDVRREEAKRRIDDEALAIIGELERYEVKWRAECAEKLETPTSELASLLKPLEKELTAWQASLMQLSKKKWKLIHQETVAKYAHVRREAERIKRSILTDTIGEIEMKQKRFCHERIEPIM